jgi:hypothetical protein
VGTRLEGQGAVPVKQPLFHFGVVFWCTWEWELYRRGGGLNAQDRSMLIHVGCVVLCSHCPYSTDGWLFTLLDRDSGFISTGCVVGIGCIVEGWKTGGKKAQLD